MFPTPTTGVISRKRALVYILLAAIIFFFIGIYASDDTLSGEFGLGDECNVLVLSANGYMSTYVPESSDEFWDEVVSSEELVDGIMLAQDDADVKALILLIDSSGGDPVAGEEVANALKRLEKPSVAVIRGIGASAAYWAATGAGRIFASEVSDVGSIGVTMSYLDQVVSDARDGYRYIELTSAKYKDVGNPSRILSYEEELILIADLNKVHEVFSRAVATNRGLAPERVAELANGLTYLGLDALEHGLIDEIGDLAKATSYLEEQIGEKPEFCWY